MHFYQFNVKDFKASTRHLSHIERALYRELMDMYYESERPITTDIVKLERVLMVKTDEEKQALQNVLAEFFVIKKLKATGDKEPMYHHVRIDKTIKKYKYTAQTTNDSTSEVQTSTNATTNDSTNKNSTDVKKAFLIESLKKQGIKANTRMKISELQTLFDEHCNQTTNASTSEVQTSTNTTSEVQTPFADAITINQEPVTKNQEPVTKKEIMTAQAEEIFEFWKSVFGKDGSTKFSDKRKAKVTARLKDGYTIDEIKQAIVNVSKNDFNVANGYTDLELICRDVEHLERYRDLKPQTQANLHLEQPKHIQDLKVNDAWDRQPPTQLPELDEEYWFMREQMERAIANGEI